MNYGGAPQPRPSLAVLCCLFVSLVGCASRTDSVRVATHSTLTLPNAAPNPALIDKHCPFGQPKKSATLEHGPTTVVTRDAYALEHDSLSKIALWVCGSLDRDLVFGPAERSNNWKPDPDLDANKRAVDADYRNSGFQRGHMVASEDRVATQALNDETFILSNAVPQVGSLNSGQWAQLEARIRQWVDKKILTGAKMITGGFFYDPAEDVPATADGLVPFQQIGANKVAVPTHIFKIVVGTSGGQTKAIAFVAENKRPTAGWRFADGIVAIRWVEERTGLDFLPDLDPGEADDLELKPSPMLGP